MEFNSTVIIVIATSLISISAFGSESLFSKLMFNPYQVHADWMHLIINMIVLYSFGSNVEHWFAQLKYSGYLNHPVLTYCTLYFGGIIIASLISLFRYRDNYQYNSVGASGAVSAVIFTSIFFAPLERLYFFAAIPIPGIVFAVLYLAYSSYMSRRNRDNINHEAHFAGAVFGFIFPLLIDFGLINHFVQSFHR
jgi:membrane associated rhomboid family serine protease